MHRTKYRAVVTLDPAASSVTSPPGPSHRLGIRVPAPGTEEAGHLEALVTTEDNEPLRPGDESRRVTLLTTDEHAPEILTTGVRFEIWTRHRIGHGTVMHRQFV